MNNSDVLDLSNENVFSQGSHHSNFILPKRSSKKKNYLSMRIPKVKKSSKRLVKGWTNVEAKIDESDEQV